MISAQYAKKKLREYASTERSVGAARFFKTGKGQYGYGDVFIGVTVPDTRKVARLCAVLSLDQIEKLLLSKIHEDRLLALLILVDQFERGDRRTQKIIYDFYLAHLHAINNWDLVDTSASKIVGAFLLAHPKEKHLLLKLVSSSNLWQRRVAVIATLAFIGAKSSEEIFMLAEHLLADEHDLMHKAVGWMLREVGKRISLHEERKFLDVYAAKLPRTALRYALEHFSVEERAYYMKKHMP